MTQLSHKKKYSTVRNSDSKQDSTGMNVFEESKITVIKAAK